MSITWSSGSSKAACDARAARLDGGLLRIYTAAFATLLAELTLDDPAFGAATAAIPSVATANPITRDESAAAGGVAAVFRAYQSDGMTVEFSGTVSTVGGGGDLELVGTTTIAAGQPVEVASFYLSQP